MAGKHVTLFVGAENRVVAGNLVRCIYYIEGFNSKSCCQV